MPRYTVTVPILRQLMRYDPHTGSLFWRERCPHHFIDGPKMNRALKCASWNARWADREAFTAITNGYHCGAIYSRTLLAHRVCWALFHGVWPDGQIDHANGNRRDNRIVNLSDVSPDENARNCKRRLDNSSGATGVFFDNTRGKWVARIYLHGSPKHLGVFDCFEKAAEARSIASASAGYHQNHGMR